MTYPKRLIEVDLPIREISAHARREKSIRHGHISTLHIWWARRPLAACRAVICAALWPDPADPLCPPRFVEVARESMRQWATGNLGRASAASYSRFVAIMRDPGLLEAGEDLRGALLAFIADFANWDNAANPAYLATSRILTQAAHEALGGISGVRPLVVDPFAGGGAIPVEALRVGAEAFASDLNPVAVLLNKVAIEYVPRHHDCLGTEVRKWGRLLLERVEQTLHHLYPPSPDGSTPIAYLWARTILCEGPACGVQIPLLRSLTIANRSSRLVHLKFSTPPGCRQLGIEIIEGGNDPSQDLRGTIRNGSVTCPACGFTTPKASVRQQLRSRGGGADDSLLYCVVTSRESESGRFYRSPHSQEMMAVREANAVLEQLEATWEFPLTARPSEPIPQERVWKNNPIRVHLYGMTRWGDLFSSRQALTLAEFVRTLNRVHVEIAAQAGPELAEAVSTCLALALDRQANALTTLCRWNAAGENIEGLFSRQAISMLWDYAETNPFSTSTGGFRGALEWVAQVCDAPASRASHLGQVVLASATAHPLPDQAADAIVTDPPYYDAVPYAKLSDFFYVWLRRSLRSVHPAILKTELVERAQECVVDEGTGKGKGFFESTMEEAMRECARILKPGGLQVVVFAHKSTSGWEAQLAALIRAGWAVTASWPIDTERGGRLRAHDSAALGSSVHIVCRPRACAHSKELEPVGDWREVLAALPIRVHEWMPRLAHEGIVGADAIFACIGPALEIFSRYSSVEKATGEVVSLKEYLEHVWAAVAREALHMIFAGADASGFEEDARLTAMWLWTLSTAPQGKGAATIDDGQIEFEEDNDEEDEDAEEETVSKQVRVSGYIIEYDAARKIAQGLGVHLERLTSLVEVKANKACLLPVALRGRWLLGEPQASVVRLRRPKVQQLSLFAELDGVDEGKSAQDEPGAIKPGTTTLDRIHQAMILFGAGRTDAMKRLLVDDGVGGSPQFWTLAQALSALYPSHTEEKRWVDGVLARKKGLGF